MLDGEELALLALGYVKCFYIALFCPQCGSSRIVTAHLPDSGYIDCPGCARPHCHSGLLATGYKKRELPRFEVWSEPVDVTRLYGLEDVKPRRANPPLKRAWRPDAAPMPAKKNGLTATARWKSRQASI